MLHNTVLYVYVQYTVGVVRVSSQNSNYVLNVSLSNHPDPVLERGISGMKEDSPSNLLLVVQLFQLYKETHDFITDSCHIYRR